MIAGKQDKVKLATRERVKCDACSSYQQKLEMCSHSTKRGKYRF